MQETPQQPASGGQTFDAQPPTIKKKSKKKWLVILPILIVVLAAGAFFFSRSPQEEPEEQELTPIESEERESPTPTPTPEPVDKSEISIRVLNGTGIAREAAFLRGKLEELGYSDIESGNASDQTRETTEVSFGSTIPEAVREEIRNKLEEIYTEVEVITGRATDADILVTTGLRPGQSLPTPTPTAEPTPTPTATESATPTPAPTPTSTP